jgi:cytochrome c oxidase subunit 2
VVVQWAALAVAAAACGAEGELPQNALDPAGPVARQQDSLWNLVFLIATGVFILVQGLILLAVFRFRDRGDATPPKQVHGNTRLEVMWTVVPALILAAIAVPTVRTVFDLARPMSDEALDVRVVGKQYWWEFEYRNAGPGEPVVTAGELHIPTGREIFITLDGESADVDVDVIHSFWVPRLAGKQDYVPGHTRTMWLEADEPGTYPGQCAEMCGLSHANMRFTVIAHEPADFEQWLEAQAAPAATPQGLAAAGAEIFGQQCVGCHSVQGLEASGGARFGPDLTHFAQRQRFAGYTFETTDENLTAWIDNPQQMKPGAQMPALGLDPEQIDALVAYLQSLE